MFISKKWMIYYIFIIPVLLILFSNFFSLYFSPNRDEVVINLGCRLVPCGDIPEGCAAGEMCQVTCSLGDTNDDGVTNILDVILAVNFVLGSGDPNELQVCATDFNQDSILNILDVVALVNSVIGGSTNIIDIDKLSVRHNKPFKTYELKGPLSKSYTISISNVLSFFSLRRATGYECVESDFCQGSCFNGIDDDNDALEDEEDPSCSPEGVRDEPSPCKNFFDIETESEVFFANGDGSCLSESSGGAHEVCVARGDDWVSINNFNTDPDLSNDQLCFDSDDFCCINTNAEGDPSWGNIYDTEGHVESELYGEVFYFVYCGDGYCQGWDHVNGVPVYRLLSWYEDDIFLGEEFNSCIWRDEDNEIHSDCPIESFNCIVSESTDTVAQYLKPIENFYLSSETNAHVSLSPSYPYQVYCSYMNFELTSDEGFPLLRVYNSLDNAHVELMDQSDSNYETYNLNTNSECFYVQEDSCPADGELQSFCVLAVSDVTNAHVEDCSLGNYDYKLCCGY